MGRRHVDGILGPQAPDGFEILLEPPHALFLRRAKRQELDVAIAECHAEDDLAAAHDVDRRDLLRDVEGLVERQQDEAEVEPQVRGLRHDAREKRQLLQALPRGAAVVHALGDRVEAERVGEPRLLHELLEPGRHVVAVRELRPEHETELHR
jgi:hypothetical protein